MQITNKQKKQALKWLCDNYFIAIYDENDEYCTSYENLIECSDYLNIPIKEILRKCREDSYLIFKGLKIKLFLVRKEKIEENIKKR